MRFSDRLASEVNMYIQYDDKGPRQHGKTVGYQQDQHILQVKNLMRCGFTDGESTTLHMMLVFTSP